MKKFFMSKKVIAAFLAVIAVSTFGAMSCFAYDDPEDYEDNSELIDSLRELDDNLEIDLDQVILDWMGLEIL